MDLGIQLAAYAGSVDSRLAELVPPVSDLPRDLHEAMRYACLAPGKRMRPAMCLASAEAVGGDSAAALDAACAIEMVHCFSLIHDDLPAIDDDELRRGQPTCHVKFGEAVAILAGDALFALAYRTLSEALSAPDRAIACVRALSRAVGSDGLVGGEALDVACEGREVDAGTLATIHSRKTGALFAASCEIGAILGGAPIEVVDGLNRFGAAIGLAFQIADDVLNETSVPATLGKSIGSDRSRQKATYPSLYGVERSLRIATETVDSAIAALPVTSEFLVAIARFGVERTR